jgi:enoyl-CoA hydratase/carnithine racemase
MELLLTGRAMSAAEAEAMGLVTRVLPDADVLPEAMKLAGKIAAMPPLAARKIKEVVLAGQDQSLESALLLERHAFLSLLDTDDKREGVAAFLEKRPAKFEGR